MKKYYLIVFVYFIVFCGFLTARAFETNCHELKIVNNYTSKKDEFIDFINESKESKQLDILAYIFNLDSFGQQAIKELIKLAIYDGVQVRILLDGIGPGINHPIDSETINILKQLGVEIKIFNPKSKITKLSNRMHDKLILNGKQALIGSSSWWDPSLYFIETDIIFSGSEVVKANNHFQEFWNSKYSVSYFDNSNKVISKDEFLDTENFKLQNSVIYSFLNNIRFFDDNILPLKFDQFKFSNKCIQLEYVYDNPKKNFADGTSKRIIELIKGAKSSITLINPYVILPDNVKKILVNKVSADNIKFTILTSNINMMSSELSSIGIEYAKDLMFFNSINTTLYELNRNTLLHSKMIMIDDEFLFIGSFNFDNLSFNSNTENGVIIDLKGAPEVLEYLKYYMSRIVQNSNLILNKGAVYINDVSRCETELNCSLIQKMISPIIRGYL